jgi:hypothetical protein
VNIGLVGLASVGSGQVQIVSALTGPNISNGAIRIFDAFLTNTTNGAVTFYAGTSTAGTILFTLVSPLIDFHSNVGIRVNNGIFANGGTGVGTQAYINWIYEY